MLVEFKEPTKYFIPIKKCQWDWWNWSFSLQWVLSGLTGFKIQISAVSVVVGGKGFCLCKLESPMASHGN